MDTLLKKLQRDYPDLLFTAGKEFCWSPKTREIIYRQESSVGRKQAWSLLHEVGHALLDHTTYHSDLELLQLETAAWQKASEVGKKYGYEVDEQHVQDCLDTYRDWLHQRSACPTCNNRSLQQEDKQYQCFNCGTKWSVSQSRFCRPYRMVKKTKTSPPITKMTFA
jgi:hypothetical protein